MSASVVRTVNILIIVRTCGRILARHESATIGGVLGRELDRRQNRWMEPRLVLCFLRGVELLRSQPRREGD